MHEGWGMRPKVWDVLIPKDKLLSIIGLWFECRLSLIMYYWYVLYWSRWFGRNINVYNWNTITVLVPISMDSGQIALQILLNGWCCQRNVRFLLHEVCSVIVGFELIIQRFPVFCLATTSTPLSPLILIKIQNKGRGWCISFLFLVIILG